MRLKYLLFLFAALLPAFLVFISPRILAVGDVQSRLLQEVEKALHADVSVDEMNWRWTPLPHLALSNAGIVHSDYELRLPKTRIYPAWSALLTGRIRVAGIDFISPEAKINSSFYNAVKNGSAQLPPINITIDKGTLSLAGYSNHHLRTKETTFSDIEFKLRKKSGQLKFTLQSRTTFADAISVKGNIDLAAFSYAGTLESRKFELPQLIETDNPIIRPLPSAVDFKCDIIGEGVKTVQVLFSGNIPSFSLQRLDAPVSFVFDQADLLLEKKDNELSAKIYQLTMREPDISFSGEVRRYFGADPELPFYLLDLAAEKIDLTDIRHRLLALLGDNSITTTVCNVVRDGRAKSATYRFDAPLSGFAFIEKMLINVDVDQARIHVPAVDLDLAESSGPIIIENGEISGHDLTSRLGNHYGSNGSFALGLAHDNHLFKLDLDIDADLAELPTTLHHLIHNENFRKEVLKFSSNGRKMGHLTIGDDLRNFSVDVRIPDLTDSEIRYSRLPWPFLFHGGMLHIQDDRIEWEKIAATAGLHEIHESTGRLSWDDPKVPFVLDNLRAELDVGSIYEQLAAYPAVKNTLLAGLIDVDGTAVVEKGTASGNILDPKEWQYNLSGEVSDMSFKSDKLQEEIFINKATVAIGDKTASFSNGEITFLGSPFSFSAGLNHTFFRQWQGWIELGGTVTPEVGNWLQGKKWIPESFFPKIPCDVKKIKINFSESDLAITGTLSNKSLTGVPVETLLDVAVIEGRHQSTRLHFFSYPKDAVITITGDHRYDSLIIDFQGTIDKQTVSAIFDSSFLLDGELEGFCKITFPMRKSDSFSFEGRIEARDLEWLWGDFLRRISFTRLSITGDKEKMIVHDLGLFFEKEEATVNGAINFSAASITPDLVLHSESLSQNTITRFIEDLSVFLKKSREKDSDKENGKMVRKLSGKLEIKAEEFIFAETIKEGKSLSYKLIPLSGIFDFSGPESVTLILGDTKFCGLEIDGTLKWRKNRSSNQFFLKNPESGQTLLEDFIACSGVKHEIITGPFQVKAALTDDNGTLSAGTFHLVSNGGVLKRMTLLSKIFTLINFTDLYQGLLTTGFNYKLLEIDGHVAENLLILDKAVMEGEGMDIIVQGNINLHDLQSDLTIFIVPFKSIDKIINIVPLIGRIIGGKKRHIITYPVKVSGNLRDPEISVLSPTAIGKAAVDFLFDTLTLPLDLLPIPPSPQQDTLPGGDGEQGINMNPQQEEEKK
ncbi:MAG: AsmA-like C-terminal domain-containing protein [Pseudomonadota bacterium]